MVWTVNRQSSSFQSKSVMTGGREPNQIEWYCPHSAQPLAPRKFLVPSEAFGCGCQRRKGTSRVQSRRKAGLPRRLTAGSEGSHTALHETLHSQLIAVPHESLRYGNYFGEARLGNVASHGFANTFEGSAPDRAGNCNGWKFTNIKEDQNSSQ